MESHLSGKIGAKKLRKLEEKQARKAQREASRRDGVQLWEMGKGPAFLVPHVRTLPWALCTLLAWLCLLQLGSVVRPSHYLPWPVCEVGKL